MMCTLLALLFVLPMPTLCAEADSLHLPVFSPCIAGIEALTEESALVWWDSIDARAKEVQVLSTDKAWGFLEPRERADARQGWIVIHGIQSHRLYRIALRVTTANDILQPGPEVSYTHTSPWIDWAFVPGRTFEMGSYLSDESPPHSVSVNSFLLSATEVTNRDYLAFCNASAHSLPDDPHFPNVNDYIYRRPNHPAVNVTWFDAAAYCEWLSTEMSLQGNSIVRLPSEAEWEHAAQLSNSKYPWGNDEPSSEWAVFAYGDVHTPEAVTSCSATLAGLYDLAGNVWEWCADWHQPYSTAATENENPAGAPIYKVLRGGSWADPASSLRSTTRGKLSPELGLSTVGFRVARSISIRPLQVINHAPNEVDNVRAN